MNAPIDITKTSEAARLAVIKSLTRAHHNTKTGSTAKQLDETSTRRPAFRPVRMMLWV